MADQIRRILTIKEVSIDEFKAQFEDHTEDVLINISRTWQKKDSKPVERDGLSFVSARYNCPWEVSDEYPFGTSGQLYWLCKKKIFGYPYPPKFDADKCYRVRVRRCKYPERNNFLLLEEVLETEVRPETCDDIYNNAYQKFTEGFPEETKELLLYSESDMDIKKAKRKFAGVIDVIQTPVISLKRDSSGPAELIEGSLIIPSDLRNFNENVNVSLKAGKVYRALVREKRDEDPCSKRTYILLSLKGKEENGELQAQGDRVRDLYKKPIPDPEDNSFLIRRAYGTSTSEAEIEWPAPGTPDECASISLEGDPNNPFSAKRSRRILKDIMSRKEEWDQSIYDYIVSEIREENDGRIAIWEESSDYISEREFRSRLSISSISIDLQGTASVFVDLDEMFTDHCYWIEVEADGTIISHGLCG